MSEYLGLGKEKSKVPNPIVTATTTSFMSGSTTTGAPSNVNQPLSGPHATDVGINARTGERVTPQGAHIGQPTHVPLTHGTHGMPGTTGLGSTTLGTTGVGTHGFTGTHSVTSTHGVGTHVAGGTTGMGTHRVSAGLGAGTQGVHHGPEVKVAEEHGPHHDMKTTVKRDEGPTTRTVTAKTEVTIDKAQELSRTAEVDRHARLIQEQQKLEKEKEHLVAEEKARLPLLEQQQEMRQRQLERAKDEAERREEEERRRKNELEEQIRNAEKQGEEEQRRLREALGERIRRREMELLKEGYEGKIPNEMRAVVLSGFGDTSKVKVMKLPHMLPAKGEVLIRARACGMNFQDILTRQGLVDNAPKTPIILGGEVAGDIVAIGDNVIDFKVGDRVVALPEFKGWAEFVNCPASVCYKLPENMSFHDAVAITMNGIVAYCTLFELGGLRPGRSVLVHSAAGGVGQMIVQMARTVNNVTIYGIASHNKEHDLEAPVDHFIERGVDYVNEIRQYSPRGVDLVLDSLCGDHFVKGYGLLKPMGKYVLFGLQSLPEHSGFFGRGFWQVEKVSPLRLYDENKAIAGFNLRHLLYFQRERGYVRDVVSKVFEMWERGQIKAAIDSRWAFENLPEAMHRMEEHGNIGKIVLDPLISPNSQEAIMARALIIQRCDQCETRPATQAEAEAAHRMDKSVGILDTIKDTIAPQEAYDIPRHG